MWVDEGEWEWRTVMVYGHGGKRDEGVAMWYGEERTAILCGRGTCREGEERTAVRSMCCCAGRGGPIWPSPCPPKMGPSSISNVLYGAVANLTLGRGGRLALLQHFGPRWKMVGSPWAQVVSCARLVRSTVRVAGCITVACGVSTPDVTSRRRVLEGFQFVCPLPCQLLGETVLPLCNAFSTFGHVVGNVAG